MKTVNRRELVILLAAAAALSSACGNLVPRERKASPAEYQGLGSVSTITTPGLSSDAFSCAEQPNVLPDYDETFDGARRYTVCRSRNNQTDIQVHGQTAGSKSICVFPAQEINSTHIYAKPDLVTGGLVHHCAEITENGVIASFPNVNFNAAFIVEGEDFQQMQACLVVGNYWGCPNYSYGKFR